MKTLIKSVTAIGFSALAIAASPVAAQVTGKVAVLNPTEVVIKAAAFQSAYQQIATTYSVQRTTIQQRDAQVQELLKQLDTNSDGNIDEAELTAAQGTPQAGQIEQIETEVSTLQNQIDRARVYAVEQILIQYGAAAQQVIEKENIQLVFAPDAVRFAKPEANIGDKVVAALNALAPNVGITPPQNWQPAQQSVALFQQVQQVLMSAQAQAQAAAAAATPAPAQPAPTGR
ncbi:hypothetical protein GCM10023115_20900 [Pontixanthobacter gangjinensis]|uniref:OmpH family outer membrane protein n=1 Tax=Pontixanthobacter gangjinensis TaxID=1028742 RepID=A0A6I4SPM7_9SPHN|nr:OmpH family outer membrane protein [Pontixanthobacter gangjinensis]MXO57338.1 OmpH family outer membrane protein [Pontixanthobacter gangjinensis]